MRNLFGSRKTISAAAFAGTLAVVAGASAIGLNAQADPLPVAPASATTQAGKLVKTTPESLLLTLLDTLPKGKTSNYAGTAAATEEDNGFTLLMAQTYLDKGQGPGMLRLSVDPGSTIPGGAPSEPAEGTKTWTQEDGDEISVTRLPDNCVQSLVVSRRRADGLFIQLNVASCLPGTQAEQARQDGPDREAGDRRGG